jgi:DNA repair protein RecO (recombination protein O)
VKKVTKGIVLSKVNYSESSLIVSVYTLDFGIQSFLFQGGKKKAAAIYPLALAECTYYKRPESDLAKVTELSLYLPNNNITMHHGKMVIAYFVSAVIKACFKHGNHDVSAYAFLESKICELNETNDVANFPIYFLIKLSDVLGISPQLNDKNSTFFYLEDGEFSNVVKMNVIVEEGQHVAYLQQFLSNSDLFLNSVTREVRKNALETLVRYFQIHLSGFQIENALEVIRATLYD